MNLKENFCQVFLLTNSSWASLHYGYCKIQDKDLIISEQYTSNTLLKWNILNLSFELQDGQFLIDFQDKYFSISFENPDHANQIFEAIKIQIHKYYQSQTPLILPIGPSNIIEVVNYVIEQSSNPSQKYQMIQDMLYYEKYYFEKLCNIFTQYEQDLSDSNLQCLCVFMKTLISFAEPSLVRLLMDDKYFNFVLGCLEQEPLAKQHRQIFQIHIKYVAVVDMKDLSFFKLINLIQRFQYIKDCALSHYLSEEQSFIMKVIIKKWYQELVVQIFNQKDLLYQLVDLLQRLDENSLMFLYELTIILNEIQDENSIRLLEQLVEMSVLEILEEIIIKNEIPQNVLNRKKFQISDKSKKIAIDILIIFSELIPGKVKLFLTNETQSVLKHPFLSFILKCKDYDLIILIIKNILRLDTSCSQSFVNTLLMISKENPLMQLQILKLVTQFHSFYILNLLTVEMMEGFFTLKGKHERLNLVQLLTQLVQLNHSSVNLIINKFIIQIVERLENMRNNMIQNSIMSLLDCAIHENSEVSRALDNILAIDPHCWVGTWFEGQKSEKLEHPILKEPRVSLVNYDDGHESIVKKIKPN